MIHRNIAAIPRETTVRQDARPLFLQNDSTDHALLLLHGYTGYVGDMRYLASRVNAVGLSVSVPRYPGHGTNSADFRRSSWRDWWRCAMDAYLELRNRYARVSVAGLSMGGVISALIAAQFPVHSLSLLAPAFLVSNPLIVLTPFLRYFLPPLRNGDPEEYPDDPDREYMSAEYWNRDWPDKLSDLLHLMRRSRRVLPSVAAPTLLVVSESDLTVPMRVRAFVERRIGTSDLRTVVLSESDHVVTNGVDRERVGDELTRFLLNT